MGITKGELQRLNPNLDWDYEYEIITTEDGRDYLLQIISSNEVWVWAVDREKLLINTYMTAKTVNDVKRQFGIEV